MRKVAVFDGACPYGVVCLQSRLFALSEGARSTFAEPAASGANHQGRFSVPRPESSKAVVLFLPVSTSVFVRVIGMRLVLVLVRGAVVRGVSRLCQLSVSVFVHVSGNVHVQGCVCVCVQECACSRVCKFLRVCSHS